MRWVDTRVALLTGRFDELPVYLQAVLVIIAMQVAKRVLARVIERGFSRANNPRVLNERRARTLGPLMKSIVSYVLSFIGLVTVLSIFGIKTTSIVATAGVASLAISFGAQNLVRDIITGFFILFEDQFAVGDYVTAAGFSGIVDEMGLRVTKIRDFGGQLYVIPNGQIGMVTNHMGTKMRATVAITVPRTQPVDSVLALLGDVAKRASKDMPEWTEGPSVTGLSRLGEASYDVDIVGRTVPMAQFAAERELRLRVKKALEEVGLG